MITSDEAQPHKTPYQIYLRLDYTTKFIAQN